jgi:TPR repeat protein
MKYVGYGEFCDNCTISVSREIHRKGLDQDIMKVLEKESEAGDSDAMLTLGMITLNMSDRKSDESKGEKLFKKAANKGNLRAQLYLSDYYAERGNFDNSMFWLKRSAEGGFPRAIVRLGVCYAVGDGVEKDMDMATELFMKAVEQGYTWAMINLGYMYKEGGAKINPEKALKWFNAAVDAGDPEGYMELGVLYNEGKIVERDTEKASVYYQKAVDGGYVNANNNLGTLYLNGDGVEENVDKAIDCFIEASEEGNVNAPRNLGIIYSDDKYGRKDSSKAAEWYEIAAERGNAESQLFLGRMYIEGNGVDENFKLGMYWISRAASGGNKAAIEMMQMMRSMDSIVQNTKKNRRTR